MLKYPLVSIITPTLNSEKYLEKTILSVISQTYENIEYIIIDGGSTDGTLNIINKYNKYLKYWISEKDKGQSHAINKGYERANGELISWLGSDDWLENDCVENVVMHYLENSIVGIFYGKIRIYDEINNIVKVISYKNINYNHLITVSPIVVQPGSFYNRIYLKDLFLDENLHYCMDYELWLRISRVAEIKYIDKILANFRIHKFSKSGKSQLNFIKEKIKISKRYGRKLFSKMTFSLYKSLIQNILIHENN